LSCPAKLSLGSYLKKGFPSNSAKAPRLRYG
jgi:hypothetical protein